MKKIKPKSEDDYTLQIWWKPEQSPSKSRKLSDPLRSKVLAEIKNLDKSPDFIAKKDNRNQIKTLADYFIDAQNRHLDDCGLMYEPDELTKIKIITLQNDQEKELKTLILKLNNGHKWIIALHGWGENKYLALHQTYLFAQLGFNILTFDACGHGQSYGEETDFGFQSYQDLDLLISYLKRNHGMNHYGIIGLSSGASTALRHLQKSGYHDTQLKFVISDCAFANLNKELKFLFEQHYPISWWKVSYSLRNKFKKYFGFEPKSYDLLKKEDMERISEIPVLFIHGKKDKKVSSKDAYDLYKQKKYFEKPNQSQLLLIPQAGHTEAINIGNKSYVKGVVNFLKTINEI